jgi:hypothetical protein
LLEINAPAEPASTTTINQGGTVEIVLDRM